MTTMVGLRPNQHPVTGKFLPGNTAAKQMAVSEVLDLAGSRREAIALLWDIARKPSNRDQYRAIERICSYYFGTPRINLDVTTDSEPAALMRQLWTAMVQGSTDELNPNTDVNVIEAEASSPLPAMDSSSG